MLVVLGAVALLVLVTRPEAEPERMALEPPAAGEVRPDHLDDGMPVWVVGHDDGTASILAGFDTHVPFGLNKLLWWCEPADAFHNPEHGSKYDEYGTKVGGPAPAGLVTYEAAIEDGRLLVGARRPGVPAGTPHSGPPEEEREWCRGVDDRTRFHTFEGWEVWASPTAAIAAQPTGWILLEGRLTPEGGSVVLCSPEGCADAAVAANVEVPSDPAMEFGPLGGRYFIAQVRDGHLVGVARVLPEPAR